jgi:hypothetical protein
MAVFKEILPVMETKLDRVVMDMAGGQDGETVYLATTDGILELNVKTLAQELFPTPRPLYCIDATQDGRFVAAGGPLGNVYLLDKVSGEGKVEAFCSGGKERVWSLAFNPGGDELALAGNESGGGPPWTYPLGNQTIMIKKWLTSMVRWNRRKDVLLVKKREESKDKLVMIQKGAILPCAIPNEGLVMGLSFSPDGTLAAWGRKGEAFVCSLENMGDVATFTLGKDDEFVTRAALSYDNQILIGGMQSGEVQLWRRKEGSLMAAWRTRKPSTYVCGLALLGATRLMAIVRSCGEVAVIDTGG